MFVYCNTRWLQNKNTWKWIKNGNWESIPKIHNKCILNLMKPSEINFQIKKFKFDLEINIFCACFFLHQPTINLSKHY
jgi:hypothetical protein